MKTVLITGANKGIGFETAKQLAQQDYFIYLASRDQAKGREAEQQLKQQGLTNVEALVLDVIDIESIKEARVTLESKLTALDVLINNAGIPGDQPQNISRCDIDVLRALFDTNYFGVVQTTQQFLPLMAKADAPKIVNVSSEVGSLTLHTSSGRSQVWDLYDAYGSTKTALNSFTVMLANELRDTNFRVNSVTPGYTATDLNNFQGLRTVAQGAKVIVDLVLQDPSGPTGKFFKEGGEVPW